MFEDFTLSVSIAGDCDRIINTPTKGSCALPGSAPGMDVFSDTVTGCLIWDEDDIYNGFCYHIPYEGLNLFNS